MQLVNLVDQSDLTEAKVKQDFKGTQLIFLFLFFVKYTWQNCENSKKTSGGQGLEGKEKGIAEVEDWG